MFEKFFKFLGLTEAKFIDGKVAVEMTEEQAEASSKILGELETAKAEIVRLAGELQTEKEQNATAQAELVLAKGKASELEEQVERLELDLVFLRKAPGATTAVSVKNSDGSKAADPYKIDLPESASVVEQLEAFKKALKE